jgi:predicted nucleotidyltransferase
MTIKALENLTRPLPDELILSIETAVTLLSQYNPEEIYLFGSIVEGSWTTSSDIDIAIKGIAPRDFFRAISDLMGAIDFPVDLTNLDFEGPLTKYLLNHKSGLIRVA